MLSALLHANIVLPQHCCGRQCRRVTRFLKRWSSQAQNLLARVRAGGGAGMLPAPPDLSGKVVRANWNATALAYLGDSVWEVRRCVPQDAHGRTGCCRCPVASAARTSLSYTSHPSEALCSCQPRVTAGRLRRSCTCGGTTSTRQAGCRSTTRVSPRRFAPRRRCAAPLKTQDMALFTSWHNSPGSTPLASHGCW